MSFISDTFLNIPKYNKTKEAFIKAISTMKILISACLVGAACRYDGNVSSSAFDNETILKLSQKHTLIPFCPEIYGGLSTPREPSELQEDGRVLTKSGKDVTENFIRGANETLNIAKKLGCKVAILKEKSPSCGYGKIYNGDFSGTLKDGSGITALLLSENGIEIYGESRILELLDK